MATPALRIRIAPKFPTKIQGSGGISVTRTGGVVTIGGASLRPYPSVTAASASKIDLAIEAVRVDGWGMPGDGGAALYKRVNLEPSHAGKFQDANGAWFELSVPAVSPEMVGGDVQASMLVASALGARWVAAPKIYTVSTLAVPDGLEIQAAGATIARVGALAARASFIAIGKNVTADELNFTFDGTELGNSPSARLVDIGDDFTCGTLSLSAAAALGYAASLNGAWATGVRTRIGAVRATNIDYPLALINPSTTVLATGSQIGAIEADGYLRTLYAQYLSGTFGNITARRRSANAALMPAPGRYISNLLEGVQDSVLGDLHMEESGHAIRIGGSPHANAKNQNITIGDIFATKTRGCVLKIDPTLLLDASLPLTPYKTERAFGIKVGNVIGIDVGDNTSEGNREFVRITRADKVSIGHCRAFIRDATFSGQAGIGLCNATAIKVASLYGDGFATLHVWVNADQDSDASAWASGPVYGVDIPVISGKSNGSSFMVVQSAPFYTMEYGDINLGMAGAVFGTDSSANTRVFNTSTGGGSTPVLSNGRKISITGTPNTVYLPTFLNVPSNAAPDNFNVDLRWNGRRFSGVPNNPRFLAGHTVQAGGFEAGTPGNQITDGMFGSYSAVQIGTAAGNLVPGGTFVASRPNSSRRGAAFGAVQIGGNQTGVGAGMWTGLGEVGEDQLRLSAFVRPDGHFELTTQSAVLIVLGGDGNRYRLNVPTAAGPVSWVAL